MTDDEILTIWQEQTGSTDSEWDVVGFARAILAGGFGEVARQQGALMHPATQVFFRAGLLACREYMARFVASENENTAASIRANWWPSLGQDFGAPRQLEWSELTEGEYGGDDFRVKNPDEVSPTQEALPIALQFLRSLDPGNGEALDFGA